METAGRQEVVPLLFFERLLGLRAVETLTPLLVLSRSFRMRVRERAEEGQAIAPPADVGSRLKEVLGAGQARSVLAYSLKCFGVGKAAAVCCIHDLRIQQVFL